MIFLNIQYDLTKNRIKKIKINILDKFITKINIYNKTQQNRKYTVQYTISNSKQKNICQACTKHTISLVKNNNKYIRNNNTIKPLNIKHYTQKIKYVTKRGKTIKKNKTRN